MPSRVLETVLTGRNLLSPVLVGAARDVDAFDAKVTAAQGRAAESAQASASVQESAAAKVTAANARGAESASLASDKTVAANARAAESARVFADVTESSTARAGIAWARMATVGLPLVGAAVALVTGKMAGDYQQLVTKLETTAGETHANLAMVSQGMLDMAGQVGVSADELAKGMYTVESAGFHGADALKVLQAGAQGAKQEQADLSHVVDAVTTSLHDYHLPASDAAKVTSELVAAVSHGKTTFDDLTGSMHSIEPVAVGAHQSIAQTAGSLAAMTASGMHADQAAQNLAHTIGSFQNATKPMRDELSQLGLDATDLQQHMGERGIAGTLQLVADRIQQKIDPSGKLLLSALQTNKTAVNDLSIMIGKMPPQLADLASGLLAGTTSQKDFRKAAQDLGGEAGAMADQFIASYKGADGFSAALKSGGPMVQTYISALAKATGTSDGLRTALMLTGENAGSTNAAIAAVAGAAAQADGSIRGWDEVQGNFNQKLAEAGAGAKTLAIEAGQHLLPVLTNVVGWVADTGIPGIQHLGGAVGDAVHWFLQLPGPVKEAAIALGIVKVLGASDMFAGLLASGRVLAVGFANDMSNMVASARAGTGQMTAAFAEAKAAQRLLVAERFNINTSMLPKATGDIAGLGAAAGVAARGGMAALKTGASSLMSLFGGPWGVTLIGATVGVMALESAVQKHDEQIQKATTDVLNWNKAISMGGGGQTALDAAAHIGDLQKQVADYQKVIDQANNPNNPYGRVSGTMITHLAELKKELAEGKQAWQDQLAAMTPVEEMQTRVDIATKDLNDALKNNPPTSLAVTGAADRLRQAQGMLAVETANANNATKTQAQLQQDAANAMLASLDASRASEMAQLQLSDAVSQYNSDVAAGKQPNEDAAAFTRRLREEQLGLVSSAQSAAQKASDLAVQQDHQNGITDTAHDAQVAFLKSLQDSANQMSGPAKQAILDMIAQLGKQQTQAQITSGAISGLGVTVTNLPSEHLIQINAPTQQQEDDLHQLGYVTTHLPDGKVVVTADTHPAVTEIQDMLQYARTQSILFRAGLAPITPGISGGGRMGGPATGGWIAGPGTGTSDTAGVFKLSHGEFVVNAAAASQHSQLLEAINGSGTVHTSGVPVLPGYATGGWIGPPANGSTAQIPVHIDQASLDAMRSGLRGMAQQAGSMFTGGGGSGGNPAMRALGQQIAANLGWASQFAAIDYIFSHESGWNPNAQNPTSTAYGIPQFLNGTWAGYGGKTSSPGLQITDGIEYMVDRYGSPNSAAAFWQAHHWYRDGTNYVPSDQLAVLHQGEAVIPAAQNQGAPYQAGLNPATGTGAATTMPGYGTVTVSVAAPQVNIQFIVDGQEFRGMAKAVVDGRLEDWYRKKAYR